MPLILIVGLPSTGKSSRARQIKELISKETDASVHIISENEVVCSKGMDKNSLYMDSQKEKEIRAILKSEALRLLTPKNVVILDGGNYIKGYRYELYCASKNSGSTQVCVEPICANSEAWDWNSKRPESEQYSKECFEALHLRYEAPDSRSRWDSPLFHLQPHDDVPIKSIYEALFLRKPPPPNQSTQVNPLSSANFLHELDKITQGIIVDIQVAQRCGSRCADIKLMMHGGLVLDGQTMSKSPAQLNRYRRQFLNYTKLHPPAPSDDPHALAGLFVHFLNTTLAGPPV